MRKIVYLLLALALLALLPGRSACPEHLGVLVGALLQTRFASGKTEPPDSSQLT